MYEFEDFVYLDVQKTGSTTIRKFFRKFAATEPVADDKHTPVDERKPGKVYIISCRDPLKQYLSLYSHGSSNKGGLRRRMNRAGLSHFYSGTTDGFASWLGLLLDPVESQKHLSGVDNHKILDFAGLQTLRFLTLAFASPVKIFETFHSREDLRNGFHKNSIYDIILKTETLTDDLRALLHGEHSQIFRNRDKADEFLLSDRRKNESEKLDIDLSSLPPEIISRVQEREWLYFDELGYKAYF